MAATPLKDIPFSTPVLSADEYGNIGDINANNANIKGPYIRIGAEDDTDIQIGDYGATLQFGRLPDGASGRIDILCANTDNSYLYGDNGISAFTNNRGEIQIYTGNKNNQQADQSIGGVFINQDTKSKTSLNGLVEVRDNHWANSGDVKFNIKIGSDTKSEDLNDSLGTIINYATTVWYSDLHAGSKTECTINIIGRVRFWNRTGTAYKEVSFDSLSGDGTAGTFNPPTDV